MTRSLALSSLCLLLALGSVGCRQAAPENASSETAREPLVPGRMPTPMVATSRLDPNSSIAGRVAETIDAGPYTYVQVESPVGSVWAAAPAFTVAVGDEVRFATDMPMQNYESRTLGRTFDLVYFTQDIEYADGRVAPTRQVGVQTSPSDSDTGEARSAASQGGAIDLSGIAVPDGGITVAGVHAASAKLAGTEVVIRGRVVKFTTAVLDHNWLHLQDGSGEGPTSDLTVVTDGEASIGDLVVIHGKVAVDQDFGFGYQYAVLVEDALVTVE